jgi:hypothetical protein
MFWTGPVFAQDDVVLRAMRDELSRSMKKLQLENLEKPYFISYTVYDVDLASRSASFGALTGAVAEQHYRSARVQVRVGDYSLDNRNFNGGGRGAGSFLTLPVDDNYDEIRRQLWLSTDSVYKRALEDIARKRAVLANKNRAEVIGDFSKEPPVTIADLMPAPGIKLAEMEKTVRDLSAIFKQTPDIWTSSVGMQVDDEYVRYVNSEGSTVTTRYPEIDVFVSTTSQAPDGQPLSAGLGFRARALSDLPPREEMAEKIRARCKDVADLRKAPLPDRYAGPILFEGQAAGEVWLDRFINHFPARPEIVSESSQGRSIGGDSENLVEKIGLRVLPEFMSVADDPTLATSAQTHLLATRKVDEEGVATRRMQLVENGLLMRLLTSRAPVQGFPHSSGSFHDNGLGFSNVIVTSAKSLPMDQLRAELLRRAKLRGKDYGIIVRKVDYSTRDGNMSGMAPGSMAVLLAYKRFADGHEELLRNAIVNGITFSAFKDILAVSDTPEVWNTRYSPRAVNPSDQPGSSLVSLVVPALLFEDVTVQKPAGDVNKPPLMEHPYFSKRQ